MFKNRVDAGQKLAKKLESLKNEKPVILAIPRGGVVIGDVIAKTLGAKLDIIVSRKVGAPNNPELAIGAVMHDGSFLPNTAIIESLDVPKKYIEQEIASELKEVERRLMKFKRDTKYELGGRTVVVVDDGIATGATMFAVVQWIKKQNPKKVIVAIPVGPQDTIERLSSIVQVVVLDIPAFFAAVGEFYDEFDQIEDSQVIEILSRYR
jgi:putative phosphoribosyl transferase